MKGKGPRLLLAIALALLACRGTSGSGDALSFRCRPVGRPGAQRESAPPLDFRPGRSPGRPGYRHLRDHGAGRRSGRRDRRGHPGVPPRRENHVRARLSGGIEPFWNLSSNNRPIFPAPH